MVYIVVAFYFGALLLIGLLAARRVRTLSDYYVGGKRLGYWVVAFSARADRRVRVALSWIDWTWCGRRPPGALGRCLAGMAHLEGLMEGLREAIHSDYATVYPRAEPYDLAELARALPAHWRRPARAADLVSDRGATAICSRRSASWRLADRTRAC